MAALHSTRRYLAGAVVLVLTLLSPAMCLAGAVEEAPDVLCLMGMAEDAGEPTAKLDCCAAQSPANAALTAQTVLVAPPVPTASLVEMADLPSSPPQIVNAIEAGAPKISRTPTYLLVSFFRI